MPAVEDFEMTLDWVGVPFGHISGYLMFAEAAWGRFDLRREHGAYIVPAYVLENRVIERGKKIGFYMEGADNMTTHEGKILDEDDAIKLAQQWCEDYLQKHNIPSKA